MPHCLDASLCELLDVSRVWLDLRRFAIECGVGTHPLLWGHAVGLRMFGGEAAHLGGIHIDGFILHPSGELLELLFRVVLADAGVIPIVPAMDAADEILPLDVAVAQQDTTVETPTVQHRYITVCEDHDEVDICHAHVGRHTVLKFGHPPDRSRIGAHMGSASVTISTRLGPLVVRAVSSA
jgi:hypothetical protein